MVQNEVMYHVYNGAETSEIYPKLVDGFYYKKFSYIKDAILFFYSFIRTANFGNISKQFGPR